MRHFVCYFNGSGKNHLAYAAYFGPLPSRSNLHCSILGHFHQYIQTGGGGLHLLGANFSSTAPRSRGGSVRLRSRQASGDPGAGARVGWMAVATGTVSARMSNMKRILSMVNGRRQEKRVPHVRMPDDRHTGLPRPLPQLRRPSGLLRRSVGDPKARVAGTVKSKRSRTLSLFLNLKTIATRKNLCRV